MCVISIAEEGMSAEAEITAPFAGKQPSVADITRHLQQQGIKRGISTKQIDYLVKKVKALALAKSLIIPLRAACQSNTAATLISNP